MTINAFAAERMRRKAVRYVLFASIKKNSRSAISR